MNNYNVKKRPGNLSMIVVCPSCFRRYSVQTDAIGDGKLVRCAMCGTVWQQNPVREKKENSILSMLKVSLFWFAVFIVLFSIIFAPRTVMRYWPASVSFYEAIGVGSGLNKKVFSVKNVSSFFVKRNGKLYMGIKGELDNISNEVQMVPSLNISLKNDSLSESSFKTDWTHKLAYKKLLPNQKVIFETDLKNVPFTNLVCEIKLNAL